MADQGKSILQCITQYQTNAAKRLKRHSASAGQAESFRLEPSTAGGGLAAAEGNHVPTAEHSLTPSGAQPSHVRTTRFYGKNRQLLIDQRVAQLKANVQQRLCTNAAADPYEHFSLQRHAFAWAAEHELAADLRTFSVEHNTSGKRSFLVSTYETFWRRYRDLLPDHRHYYEIIQESYPCHLYFDLEFQKGYNEDVDGQGMVDKLLELIAQQLKAMYQMSMQPAWILELESDAPHKFSRHLIINIPGKAFANNLHAGCFVSKVCQAAIDPDTGVSSLQVAKSLKLLKVSMPKPIVNLALVVLTRQRKKRSEYIQGGGTGRMVDTAVYTRNRAFRLYLSSKAGRGSILTSTGRFPNNAHSQKQIFMQSLICNVSPNAQLLHCFDHQTQLQPHGLQHPFRRAAACQASIGQSPYPALDSFVASACKQGGVQGSIRSWVHWEDIGAILYNIKDNRWCGNINRAHKSNGIYIIADLQGGVWYQRCYDPDCRDYRSETMPIPLALIRETQCTRPAGITPALENSSTGVLRSHDDSDEAVMLAALEQYESKQVMM